MASLKYGCITPRVETKEYPVAASQTFYCEGVVAVYLDGNGNVAVANAATATLLGVAIVPKRPGAGVSDETWVSSATAGKDKIAVILATETKANYMFPADDTVTEAMKGNACDIVVPVAKPLVDIGTSVTDVFIIQDLGSKYGGTATDVVVKINPAKIQADT